MELNEAYWCSWCHKKTTHKLVKKKYFSRNEFQCTGCNNYTVQCRFCKNMATYKASSKNNGNFIKSLKDNWASELCAEHNGTIANFEKLNHKLNDLKDYEVLFKNSKWNIARTGKITAGIVAGSAIFGPLTYIAAPGMASALGLSGVLRTAGTNSLIRSLSSIAIITATGAAIGATQGGVISNNYFGAVKNFKITKINDGTGPSLIFINGFLSQKDQDPNDWINSVSAKYHSNPYYYVSWESKSLYEMGSLIIKSAGGKSFIKFISKLMRNKRDILAKKINPLSWALTGSELIGNPWHASMVKASMTGILLADLIARTENQNGYILMGHSLGCRVIYYLLKALSDKKKSLIKDVFLLGGAVDRKDTEGWSTALKAVNGNLINCYSLNDSTLKFLYKGANAFLSSPIGLGEIELNDKKVINRDVGSIIGGHMEYKENFDKILGKIICSRPDEFRINF